MNRTRSDFCIGAPFWAGHDEYRARSSADRLRGNNRARVFRKNRTALPIYALPRQTGQNSNADWPLQLGQNKQNPDQIKKVLFGCFSLLQPPAQMGIPPISEGCGRSSGVEHNLAKVRVGRSNRLARSIRILSPNRTSKGRLRAAFLVFTDGLSDLANRQQSARVSHITWKNPKCAGNVGNSVIISPISQG
jgi:hypothetical protein